MQLLKITVRLSGQRTHDIQKGVRGEYKDADGVKRSDAATPAEVIILRALHGKDAVDVLEILGQQNRSHTVERERLRGLYGAVVDTCFPGFNTKLPLSLDDIADEPVPTIVMDNEIGTGTMLAQV